MTEITTQDPQGIVDQINDLTIKKLQSKKLLAELTQELEETELYKRVQSGEEVLKNLSNEEAKLKETGKELMLNAWMKKFEALDWTVVQLNKKPWALTIEDDTISALDEYRVEKTTTSIDKKLLKEHLKQWDLIDGVSIKEDYTLVIKHS